MKRSFCLAALTVVVPLVACSSARSSSEDIGRATSPIINGNVDTTHQAVVAVIGQSGTEQELCSGSIIKIDPASHIGWVLTAAHCVDDIPPTLVIQGNDFSAATGDLQYAVLDYMADPGYMKGTTTSAHDFGMIRIIGVDATTPTLDLAGTDDGLAVGTDVESVGFGRTSLIASGTDDTNTLRYNVDKVLSQVTSSQIAYDMATDGICEGDSGGPVLVTIGGVQKIGGVHSYVAGDCNGKGVSGRASYGLSFINQELALTAPADDCSFCEKVATDGNGICVQKSAACLADTECAAYAMCIQNGTAAATCATQNPKGEGPYDAVTDCSCDVACIAECGSGLGCRNVPKCGITVSDATCKTCAEGMCCDEMLACQGDGNCYSCVKNGDTDPTCAANAARIALATCAATKCTDECASSGLQNGAPPGATDDDAGTADPAAGSSTTTITKHGCAVAAPGGATQTRGGWLAILAMAGALVTAGGRSSRRSRRSRSAPRD